jgi:hypothetical protein
MYLSLHYVLLYYFTIGYTKKSKFTLSFSDSEMGNFVWFFKISDIGETTIHSLIRYDQDIMTDKRKRR